MTESGSDKSVLELRGVTKRFKQKTVLDQLDFSVPRGSVTGLLGKNGAGKTTLLKCALGLQSPQAGTITVLGEDSRQLSGSSAAARRRGWRMCRRRSACIRG